MTFKAKISGRHYAVGAYARSIVAGSRTGHVDVFLTAVISVSVSVQLNSFRVAFFNHRVKFLIASFILLMLIHIIEFQASKISLIMALPQMSSSSSSYYRGNLSQDPNSISNIRRRSQEIRDGSRDQHTSSVGSGGNTRDLLITQISNLASDLHSLNDQVKLLADAFKKFLRRPGGKDYITLNVQSDMSFRDLFVPMLRLLTYYDKSSSEVMQFYRNYIWENERAGEEATAKEQQQAPNNANATENKQNLYTEADRLSSEKLKELALCQRELEMTVERNKELRGYIEVQNKREKELVAALKNKEKDEAAVKASLKKLSVNASSGGVEFGAEAGQLQQQGRPSSSTGTPGFKVFDGFGDRPSRGTQGQSPGLVIPSGSPSAASSSSASSPPPLAMMNQQRNEISTATRISNEQEHQRNNDADSSSISKLIAEKEQRTLGDIVAEDPRWKRLISEENQDFFVKNQVIDSTYKDYLDEIIDVMETKNITSFPDAVKFKSGLVE